MSPHSLPGQAALRPSVVYFAKRASDGAIKVGVTVNLYSRLSALKHHAGCEIELLATVPGERWLEQQFHRLLAEDRIEGEWYRPTERVMQAAAGMLLSTSQGDDALALPTAPARPSLRRRSMERSDDRRRREQIMECQRHGLTAKEIGFTLGISSIRLTREIRLMKALGYFD